MSAVPRIERTPMPPGEIAGPSAWYGGELASSDHWIRTFSDAELAEIHSAMRSVLERGIEITKIAKGDFPLPQLGPQLDALRSELLEGRGFVLLRGLPVERYTYVDGPISPQ